MLRSSGSLHHSTLDQHSRLPYPPSAPGDYALISVVNYDGIIQTMRSLRQIPLHPLQKLHEADCIL